MDRNSRQKMSQDKWINAGSRGTVEAATAYGKSVVGMNVIRALRRNDVSRTVVIVVPTIVLKNQWEKLLIDKNLNGNTKVYVINSLIKLTSIDCKLLILDE